MIGSEAAALTFFAAPFGAAIGSFLNVVIHRLPLGQSLSRPRSRCPGCETQIRAIDNIPLVSWLVLRGRCRTCGERISVRYPLVELVTAVAFVAVVLARGWNADLLALLPFTAMLVAVAAIDLDHQIVPDKILLPAAGWGILTAALVRTDQLPELLIAGAGAFLFLLIAALIHPGGMGMGDVKLARGNGSLPGHSGDTGASRGVRNRGARGRGDDPPRRPRRPEEGRAVRAVPGARRPRRGRRRARAGGSATPATFF